MQAWTTSRWLALAATFALLLAVAPSSLGQTSPAPATADAATKTTGTVEPWTFTFNASADVPANGSVLVAFPDGFELTAETACVFHAPENTSTDTVLVEPRSVVCALGDNGIANGTNVSLQIDGIQDPTTAGPTGTFQIDLRDENGSTVGSHEAPSQEIAPHSFSSGPHQYNGDNRANEVQTHRFDFTLYNAWEADGGLEIVFPSGYGIDADSQGSSQATFTGGADGSLDRVAASGTTLAFQRTGGTTTDGGVSVTVEVTQVQNPGTEGWTGPFTVRTLAPGGGVHDQGDADGVYITGPDEPQQTSSPPPPPPPSPSPSPTPEETASPTPEEPAGQAQDVNETPPEDSNDSEQGPRSWNLGDGGPGGASPGPTVAVALVVLGLVGAGVAMARRRSRQ